MGKYLPKYFPAGVNNLLEPACGPGYWLSKICPSYGLGIDINPQMVSWCNGIFKEIKNIHVIIGDMRRIPEAYYSYFDLAINLEKTIGHLESEEDLALHLDSIRKSLRVGGFYYLGCPLENDYGDNQYLPSTITTDWSPLISGGDARLEMWNTTPRNSLISTSVNYQVSIRNSIKYPKFIKGYFDIRNFRADLAINMITKTNFRLLSASYLDVPGMPESQNLYNLGLVNLVLQAI